jgi:hypothetical protein
MPGHRQLQEPARDADASRAQVCFLFLFIFLLLITTGTRTRQTATTTSNTRNNGRGGSRCHGKSFFPFFFSAYDYVQIDYGHLQLNYSTRTQQTTTNTSFNTRNDERRGSRCPGKSFFFPFFFSTYDYLQLDYGHLQPFSPLST